MITKDEYLKAKEIVTKYEEQLELQIVSYYYLKDGDEVMNGDEYYDYDEAHDWVTIKDQLGTYKHDTETCYRTRRKI